MRNAIIACLVALAPAAHAVELGAGVATYHESGQMTPFVAVGFNPYPCASRGEYTTTYVSWSRDEDTHHASLIYTLPFYETRQEIKLYFDAGAGMQWEDFEEWKPEIAFGLSACGPVLGFITRAAWTHLETGGASEADDVFSVGVYFGRPRAQKI